MRLAPIRGVTMARVTLRLDEATAERLRAAARAQGVSMSAWLARLVSERTRREWPPEVATLAGAWRDLPLAEELRSTDADDVPRAPL